MAKISLPCTNWSTPHPTSRCSPESPRDQAERRPPTDHLEKGKNPGEARYHSYPHTHNVRGTAPTDTCAVRSLQLKGRSPFVSLLMTRAIVLCQTIAHSG